jgi:hypothetical protein
VQQGDGIHVLSLPGDDCAQATVRLVIPGGAQPDWSPAPVNPGPRDQPPPPPCTSCKAPEPGTQQLALQLPKRVTVKALRRGFTVRVATPAAGTLSAKAAVGRKRVGSGRASAAAAGRAQVRIRFAKRSARVLKRAKRLSVTVAFRPAAGGAAQTAKATVRVGR